MTLTLSGYKGATITGLTLSMRSNTSKGAGSLSMTSGSDTLASIADSKFNTANWHGAWSTSYVDVTPTVTATTIGDNTVIITIAASTSSLYCQSFTITYEPPAANTAPVATGTGSATTAVGAQASVDLSALFTDADGDTLTYTADNGATVNGSTLTYTPASAGTTTINVTATDPSGDSANTTVTIIATAGNIAPTLSLATNGVAIASGSTITNFIGNTVTITLNGSDANGDSLTYYLGDTALPSATYNYTPSSAGSETLSFRAYDGEDYSAPATLTVYAALAAPDNLGFSGTTPVSTTLSWNSVDGADKYLVNAELLPFFTETFDSCNGSGPPTDGSTWSGSTAGSTLPSIGGWSFTTGYAGAGCARFGTGSAQGIATTPTMGIAGDLTLTFRAGAWNGDSTTLSLTTSAGTLSNSSVQLENNAWSTYTVTITDATPATRITFKGANTKNSRFFLDDVKVYRGTALTVLDNVEASTSSYSATGLLPGTGYAFTVAAVATNSAGAVVATSAPASAIVTTRANSAPTISTDPANTASVVSGHMLSVALTAADADNDAVELSVLPSGVGTLSETTFTWTPTATGQTTFTFTAADPYGASTSTNLAVTVTENHDPVLSDSNATLSVLEGQTASATISATDADNDSVTVTMTSGPQGATFADGAFSWTAPAESAGTYTAVFSASDGCGGTDTLTLTITVTSASANAAPEVTVAPATVYVNVRDQVEAEITATDPNGDNVTLSMSSETIPQVAFDSDDEYGILTWTPTATGTYTATFTATDDADEPLSSTATLTVVVTNAAPTLSLSDSTLSCVAGDTVTATVSASDLFVAPGLSVRGGGSLGATTVEGFTSSATWSWTPTTPGEHTITFTATDADDNSLTSTATLTVTVGLAAPTLSVSGTPTATSAVLAGSAVTGAEGYLVTYSGVATNTTTFYDIDFETFTSTNSQSIATKLDTYLPGTGWTGEYCYMRGTKIGESLGGTYALQIGSSSASGNIVSPPINDVFPGSKLYVSCYVTAEDNGSVYFATMDATNGVRSWVRLGSASNPMDAGTTRFLDLQSSGYGLTIQPGDRLVIEGQATAQANRIRIDNLKVWGTQSTVADAEKTVGFASFPATLTGLEPRTVYTATAVATNGTTASPASNAVLFETFGLYDPANLAFSGTTHNSTTLSWDAVANAESYRVSATSISIGNPVINETFDFCNNTSGGTDGNFSAASGTEFGKTNGWEFVKGYPAKECVKIGTSDIGSATSPALGTAGDYILTFRAAPWGTDKTHIALSLSGGGTLSTNSVSTTSGQWTDYTVNIFGATAATKITFENDAGKHRFFLDDVVVVQKVATPIPAANLSVSGTSCTATGLSPETTYTFTVTAVTTVDNEEITSSASADVTTTDVPPPPPTALILF